MLSFSSGLSIYKGIEVMLSMVKTRYHAKKLKHCYVISNKGYLMELKYTKDIIYFDNKVITELDKFVIDFIAILSKYCNLTM